MIAHVKWEDQSRTVFCTWDSSPTYKSSHIVVVTWLIANWNMWTNTLGGDEISYIHLAGDMLLVGPKHNITQLISFVHGPQCRFENKC